MISMRSLLLLAALAQAEPSIRIVTPADQTDVVLQDGALTMSYAVSGITSNLRLCAQLTNKRVSFESHTHCVAAQAPVTTFRLGGILPGVWRARTVLRTGPDPPTLWRGAAPLGVGPFVESWFLVERDTWLREIGGDGPNATAAKRVLQFASEDDALREALRATADRGSIVITMANLPHAELALNLAFSVARSGAPPLFVMALSDATVSKLRDHGVACGRLPTLFGSVDGRKDVQSSGFSEIAVLKPLAVAVVLRAGVAEVWWVDTDVVVLRDLRELRTTSAFAIQAGGLHSRDYAVGEAQFHAEQCTGVFRATPEAEALLVQSALELAHIRDAFPERTWAGDQAATNLVLHERFFRDACNISVEVWDPLVVPGGGLFYEGPLHEDRGPLVRADPVLAHNNFLVGEAKKLERFAAFGMWYAAYPASFTDALRRIPAHVCQTLEVLGVVPETRSIEDVVFVQGRTVLHVHDACALEERVVAVASLGARPWVSTLIPRVAAYAKRVDADLLVAGDASRCYVHDEGDNGCAKAFKLIVLRSALRRYKRVLLLDDTVVVRRRRPRLAASMASRDSRFASAGPRRFPQCFRPRAHRRLRRDGRGPPGAHADGGAPVALLELPTVRRGAAGRGGGRGLVQLGRGGGELAPPRARGGAASFKHLRARAALGPGVPERDGPEAARPARGLGLRVQLGRVLRLDECPERAVPGAGGLLRPRHDGPVPAPSRAGRVPREPVAGVGRRRVVM